MRIGELARASGVTTRALRYYEERGLLRSRRQGNGYREYDQSAVTRVHNIRLLLDAGLSAENIREMNSCLEEDLAHVPTCLEAVALYEQRLLAVRRQLMALGEVESRLEEKLRQLRTDHRTSEVSLAEHRGGPASAFAS
ncbi:MerR family transcriptional regulator [Actinokineospora spheciospongiae]|uniref:MerR family transcriptional regulator n=1 Tax=Actinokineospora spheciospongiae TaxID=909613 RepID=UPI000D71909B|nr:MerR family transcriptional regulator [Actinokineospora spheciospongiae]PWW55537.1 DNA-binding transcriptional MerR regulator [Actinokineospora spheciospongiae]